MTVHIRAGDLLQERSEAVVNTVNCVGVMGKGIAEQFKRKWPANFREYKKACDKRALKPGSIFIYEAGGLTEEPRYIINFPTKLHWKQPSKIEYITEGLKDLVKHIHLLKIKSIAIPPLGCGNGGLDWDVVRPCIVEAFKKLPDVEVTLFAPVGAPPPQTMVTKTERPKMTPGRAAVLLVFSAYKQMQYAIGRIEAQKLAYFLQEAGEPLGLDFHAHTYGPYSDKLRHVLAKMEGHFLHGVGDNAGSTEMIIDNASLMEADAFIKRKGFSALKHRVERVRRLISGFESPFGMELLGTVLWVMRQNSITQVDDVIKAVHEWSERKKELLNENDIRLAWQRLRRNKWA